MVVEAVDPVLIVVIVLMLAGVLRVAAEPGLPDGGTMVAAEPGVGGSMVAELMVEAVDRGSTVGIMVVVPTNVTEKQRVCIVHSFL